MIIKYQLFVLLFINYYLSGPCNSIQINLKITYEKKNVKYGLGFLEIKHHQTSTLTL